MFMFGDYRWSSDNTIGASFINLEDFAKQQLNLCLYESQKLSLVEPDHTPKAPQYSFERKISSNRE